ncbi:MAG: hypothetical protein ACYC49_04405 [Ignavibacteriaceae bacterium]
MIKSLKLIFYYILIISLIIAGCKPSIPFTNKSDLLGNWKGEIIKITTPSNLETHFPIRKYGYASFSLNKDNSYTFSLTILRDVILDKNILGNNYSKILIKAVYKDFNTGNYTASDSAIIFLNNNGIIANKEKYFFTDRTLYTEYSDKNQNIWLISWEKENN